MPRPVEEIAKVAVTPRFEIFYALQALENDASDALSPWRAAMGRAISRKLQSRISAAAPSPLIWPLIADSLRNELPDISFRRIVDALSGMEDAEFQRSVLGGVFKSTASVDALVSGESDLRETVTREAESHRRLLSVVGLFPFREKSGASRAFARLVSEPKAYREEIVSVLGAFWETGFRETWATLEPQLHTAARKIRSVLSHDGFASFARAEHLPIVLDNGAILPVRGGTRTPLSATPGVIVIPSIFNTAKLWAAYTDADNYTRFFIPLVVDGISLQPPAHRERKLVEADPALVFKALGDTTRYAIATTIARTPMTSVELARVFAVSKPTISHHVQQLRAAYLLIDEQSENGVVLSLNRSVLERASSAAAAEMFSGVNADVVKRSRSVNRTRH